MNMEQILIDIQRALKGKKFDLGCEKRLQSGIEKAFEGNSLHFKREVVLDKESIVDFMVGSLAIEIKIYTKASAI